MKLRFEKNIRILTDILGHCHFLGGNICHTDFSLLPTHSHIVVQAEIPNLSSKAIADTHRTLNIPRQKDLEQNYWNISGEEAIDGELMLAGIMVDTASVSYDGKILTIDVVRQEETAEE
ncbi:hypothetical protein LJC61_04220 [Ruminococcaceae bacterium OttesenSCG-928-A16]|nr:hypothetical protein [Ruminococcaceae bacterium OttesenSCG-928-A16]